jgi:hypothetical protein
VRPDSANTTAWLAAAGGWGNNGIFQIDNSFIINDADANTPRYTRTANDPVDYSTDCDPGVMFPIPPGGQIEGYPDYVCPGRVDGDYQGDCHLLVTDFANGFLYESYRATFTNDEYYTECDIAWDLALDAWGPPPAPGSQLPPVDQFQWGIGRDCTGPDAAGFPIAPLLFTIGDVQSGRVQHAIRFILPNDRMQRAPNDGVEGPMYSWPATHAGGPQAIDPAAPVYGSRWRLRPDFDPAAAGLDPQNPVVIAVVYGLQHHGMLLAAEDIESPAAATAERRVLPPTTNRDPLRDCRRTDRAATKLARPVPRPRSTSWPPRSPSSHAAGRSSRAPTLPRCGPPRAASSCTSSSACSPRPAPWPPASCTR